MGMMADGYDGSLASWSIKMIALGQDCKWAGWLMVIMNDRLEEFCFGDKQTDGGTFAILELLLQHNGQ